MEEQKLREIGYREHYYGYNSDNNTNQCFNCQYGQVLETEREKVKCSKWNIVVDEDAICDSFELAQYWAFNCMDEDRVRRDAKLANARRTKVTHKSSEGCYIATAVYGGYDKPEVMVLRKYRDEVLKRTVFGRAFIKTYYFISPGLATRLKNKSWMNGIVRKLLDKIIAKIENRHV